MSRASIRRRTIDESKKVPEVTDPQKFVRKVWDLQHGPPGARRFVSHKNWSTGGWKDVPLRGDDPTPELDEDWYFTPCLFEKGRRVRENYLPSRVLYADLDEKNPKDITDVPPTLAWKTSEGRYQGLWVIDRHLPLERFESLNRRLTYHVGADKGGWSSTKVLRVPGSYSTKYGGRFRVKLVSRGPSYTVQDLMRLLDKEPQNGHGSHEWDDLPNIDDVWRRWRRSKLPARAKQLLRTTRVTPGDDRSAKLWELYGLLLRHGLSPEETLVVARQSAWNKFKGQRRELAQLRREVAKAAEVAHSKRVELTSLTRAEVSRSIGLDAQLQATWNSRKHSHGFGYLNFNEFLEAQFPEPEWLVEGFWGKGAYGVWAGQFKAYKTVTLLDFALSVASGHPFLGRFQVPNPGGVLYAHDEGTPGFIKDRLWRIAAHKGLGAKSQVNGNQFMLEFPADLPNFHIATLPKFNLTEKKSQEKLDRYCADEEPRLIILESFYLMAADVDENVAHEVVPALTYLKELADKYGTSIIVSHHYNKDAVPGSEKRRSGLRISGSSAFGRWYESAVYLERKGEDDEHKTVISAEHREHRGVGKMMLQIEMEQDDEEHYEINVLDTDIKGMGENEDVDTQVKELASKKKRLAIEIPCPVCGVAPGTKCKDEYGKKRAYHPSRVREGVENGKVSTND